MKTFVLALFTLSILGSCNNSKSAADLLKDEKKKEDILTTIANDPVMVAGLASRLAKSGPAVDALAGDKDLMKILHSDAHLALMAKNDTSMMMTTTANLAEVALKDSASTAEFVNAVLNNSRMSGKVEEATAERGKPAKEHKHSAHKKRHHGK